VSERLTKLARGNAVVAKPLSVGDRHIVPLCELSLAVAGGGGSGESLEEGPESGSGTGGGAGGAAKANPVAILVVDGKEYEDGNGMSRETFYNQLSDLNPPPTTAAPSIEMFTQVYRNLLEQNFDRVVSIHVASALSSMHSAAQIAAESFNNAVSVIDSGQLSMGLGFQVLAAARATAHKNLEQVINAIHSVQRRIKVIAMLDTMEQLRRSGRVSWMQAGLGAILQVKLFVELKEGQVLRLGEARTRKKALQRLGEMLKNLGPLEQLSILHSNAPEDAQYMAEGFPLPDHQLPSIRNVTTIIGTHVGVNALGFAAVLAE
jgi:DegV family protein with EDD domain